MNAELRAMVPGTHYEIVVRSTGAVAISTNVQVDRDHLEVSTPEGWASIVELVAALQAAQSAALTSFGQRQRHDYAPSSDLDGSPCAICGDRPGDNHHEFAPAKSQ